MHLHPTKRWLIAHNQISLARMASSVVSTAALAVSWSSASYLRMSQPRLRPALDLLQRALIASSEGPGNAAIDGSRPAPRVLDLGCGPGNITPYLAQAFPSARITGLDFSPDMIRSAKTNVSDVLGAEALVKHSDGRGRVDFELGTVEDLICRIKAGNGTSASPSKYDVVYSNAALHWVEDHPSLFADMLEHLVVSGGVLAVQVPETRFQPSHMLLRDAITAAGFSGEVGDIRLPIIPHSAQDYYTMVASRCSDVDIWSTEYMQQLPVDETYTPISSTAPDATVPRSRHPVVQYVKATGMLPILTALGGEPSERAQRYLDAYERLITEAYPIVNTPGASKPVAIFPFRRLFIIAKKL